MTISLDGLTVGYLLHVAGSGPPARVYRETVELAVVAEELGFTSFWVAQHRSAAAGGMLPAPLVTHLVVQTQPPDATFAAHLATLRGLARCTERANAGVPRNPGTPPDDLLLRPLRPRTPL